MKAQLIKLTGRSCEQIAQLKSTDIDFQWNKITMKDKVEQTYQFHQGSLQWQNELDPIL